MTKKQQAHALQIAMHLRSMAQIASTPGNLDTLSASAANELERQHARIAELEDDLQFVERWAVHHGSKPSISAEEALSCIQHYPAIHEITKSYKDGKRPDTFNPYARIAELESQLEAIGAGGVEPLRKPAAAPPAVQAAVPEAIEQMAVDRYKVVPSHESMFHRWAVVAGNGTQQLYIGREGECQNMARKFMGAFLDGSFVAMQNAATAHPAEEVSTLNLEAIEMPTNPHSAAGDPVAHIAWAAGAGAVFAAVETALAATQPAAQGMDAQTIVEKLPRYTYGYKSDEWGMNRCLRAYQDNAGTFLMRDEVLAALAAQAKQGGAA